MLLVFKIIKNTEKTATIEHELDPQVIIDPGKAFCQRVKFVMRLKRRMKDFKLKKLLKKIN